MCYSFHFKHADDVVAHLNRLVPSLTDPFLKSKYAGFVSVAAVTVYEMAIKEIFICFARKKHKVLGNFTESYFDRINGRIKLKVLKDDYIPRFGKKYKDRFCKHLDQRVREYLIANGRDITTSYGNLIVWRNAFAHQGSVPSSVTFEEVVQAYKDGKEVIHCLAKCMTR